MKNIFKKNKILKRQKVFCIGFNKTGTTSLEFVLKEFGYTMGHQPTAELLLNSYKIDDWKPILKYCETASAFQDVPFSLPNTWRKLIIKYPQAKFILTHRNEEEWYNSILKFHSKMFSKGIIAPTKKELQDSEYRYKGFMWDFNQTIFKAPHDDPYNKSVLIERYIEHNEDVVSFFKSNRNFIKLDVGEKDSYQKLCQFLNKKPIHDSFPHLNITRTNEFG